MDATVLEPIDQPALRQAMVSSQLRPNAVDDPRVVAAMARVPRERFLPDTSAALAYRDALVPIGRGRHANLPMATGRLLTEAFLRPDDRALLIGAAGGYTAAVLAGLVREVVAVESDPVLVGAARAALAGTNVTLIEGDLADGHAAGGPFDVLIIDGAIERLPDTLIEQVAIGGRITTGLIDRGVTRLASGRRSRGGAGIVPFADAECARLPGFAEPPRFRF